MSNIDMIKKAASDAVAKKAVEVKKEVAEKKKEVEKTKKVTALKAKTKSVQTKLTLGDERK